MITQISFEGLTLPVKSVKESVHFYTSKLGAILEINAAPHFGLVRFPRGPSIGFVPGDPTQMQIDFQSEDLDQLYEELKTLEIEIQQPPHDEGLSRTLVALDNSGYKLQFSELH